MKRLLILLLCAATTAHAQTDSNEIKAILRRHINALAAPAMAGRGYVDGGIEKAADYVAAQFRAAGLKSPRPLRDYRQHYSVPVNTFPGEVALAYNGRQLKAGAEYLTDAASAPIAVRDLPLKVADFAGITRTEDMKAALSRLDRSAVWVVMNADSFCRNAGIPVQLFPQLLPAGCYLLPEHSKLMWTVAPGQMKATVFNIPDTAVPPLGTLITATVVAGEEQHDCDNIVGVVPGTGSDSVVIFSAHYDHLGKMGAALFPGASDNASGTAMLLWLAQWFATHPQRYTLLFIAFSGEEAGLLGSEYYVKYPVVPLSKVRFVTNVDIMGDATDGVTVVNATEYPQAFSLLNGLNEGNRYLPVIKSRGKAANSDHYHFTEAGVPAFFIYSNGGMGYYHDVFDVPGVVTLNHVVGVAALLREMAGKL
ncbi:MAG: M28 family peptidase [Chitinophagaceae bacterium]|nr:M28 family peptidase [Chitinophagaceae bacterium]